MEFIDDSATENNIPGGADGPGNIKLNVSVMDLFNHIGQHMRRARIDIRSLKARIAKIMHP